MLTDKTCVPCRDKAEMLQPNAAKKLLLQVPGWALAHGGIAIFRKYAFKDFDSAFAFTTQVAKLAQQQGHHPDISFGYSYVKLKLWTKDIGGLHENDFIMAAKINTL
jgi:4a-hydroxytetrahydrobiopterin dehydratase